MPRSLPVRAVVTASTTLALLALLSVAAGSAAAGPFGGFASQGDFYLSGTDQVCRAIALDGPTSRATPTCEVADDRRIAAARFRQGSLQKGRGAVFAASARGNELTLTRQPSGETVVVWSSFDPIADVVAVHADDKKRLVAVEYQVRFGGRVRVETVGFVVSRDRSPGATPDADPSPDSDADPTGPAPGQTGTADGAGADQADGSAAGPTDSPELSAALERARRLDKRGRARPAETAYRAALALDEDHPEARYGLAKQLAKQLKRPAAVAALQRLAASRAERPDAIEWLVEARFERAFAALRADPDFRKATGLDRDPARERPLYERLFGFSDTWEQAEVKCEQAEVRLAMKRRQASAKLTITSRCGGFPSKTRLSGNIRLRGDDRVELVLPNRGGPEEVVACEMATCSDEDCLRCAIDRDLSFTLLPVRR